jgi:NADH:ubiquinone oxidoreductase subunit 5 (subunit L)/multisubunit Na+/H+ antiporter MnhA subunit
VQGLVNLASDIGDGIAVLLPAFCYIAAWACLLFAGWTLWTWSQPHHHHHHRHKPWVPFISLVLAGVFISFPRFLAKANVSAGTNLAVTLTGYSPTVPGSASNLVGANPQQTAMNVVALFQHFFQAFGAACVFWAIVRWRAIVNGRSEGSPTACAVQFIFGVMCINVVSVANSVLAYFATGG